MANLRLRELRANKKLTQADVAAYLQIARESYSRYESGEREMTYDALIALARLFSVSTDYLLGCQDAVPSFLSEEERAHIERYRVLDERGRKTVNTLLELEYALAAKAEVTKKPAM